MKVCFNGCSITEGKGYVEDQRKIFVYPWLVGQAVNCDLDNIAVGGSTNHQIFLRSADAIVSQKYQIVITQWSALNRLRLYPGPDTTFFVNDRVHDEYTYRHIHISKSQKKYLQEILLILNHDWQNIFDLIDYCRILEALCKEHTKLIFVNGLLPWTSDLVLPVSDNLNCHMSDYTKEILDFDNRDDKEVIFFFQQLRTKFKNLNQKVWVNLFDSIQKMTVDYAPLDNHPGPISHRMVADKIINHMRNQSKI